MDITCSMTCNISSNWPNRKSTTIWYVLVPRSDLRCGDEEHSNSVSKLCVMYFSWHPHILRTWHCNYLRLTFQQQFRLISIASPNSTRLLSRSIWILVRIVICSNHLILAFVATVNHLTWQVNGEPYTFWWSKNRTMYENLTVWNILRNSHVYKSLS